MRRVSLRAALPQPGLCSSCPLTLLHAHPASSPAFVSPTTAVFYSTASCGVGKYTTTAGTGNTACVKYVHTRHCQFDGPRSVSLCMIHHLTGLLMYTPSLSNLSLDDDYYNVYYLYYCCCYYFFSFYFCFFYYDDYYCHYHCCYYFYYHHHDYYCDFRNSCTAAAAATTTTTTTSSFQPPAVA